MTTPAPVGTPDWLRTYAAARVVFVNDGNVQANPVVRHGPLAVANISYLGIQCTAQSASGILLLIEWFIDSAMTILITFDEVDVNNGGLFDQTIPVKGPYCRVSAFAEPAGPVTYSLVVYESSESSISQRGETDNILIATNSQSVGANGATTLSTGRVWSGPASLQAYSDNATTWNVDLEYVTTGGTTQSFLHLNQALPVQVHQIYLPPAPIKVALRNFDASARNFIVNLIAQPWHP
jgi:hypothetical protein